jgi:hypothetical protein
MEGGDIAPGTKSTGKVLLEVAGLTGIRRPGIGNQQSPCNKLGLMEAEGWGGFR